MSIEGHDCWEDCDEGPHGCVCGNDCSPSIREYTPTTEEVRIKYRLSSGRQPGDFAEFDRWLAAHDAVKRAEWEAEQDTLPQCGYCGNNLRGLPGCPTHGAEQGETEWEYTTADFDGSPITDEMLGIMAQAFFEATGTPGSGIRYTRMTVKPEIVAGLRAALEAAEEARR